MLDKTDLLDLVFPKGERVRLTSEHSERMGLPQDAVKTLTEVGVPGGPLPFGIEFNLIHRGLPQADLLAKELGLEYRGDHPHLRCFSINSRNGIAYGIDETGTVWTISLNDGVETFVNSSLETFLLCLAIAAQLLTHQHNGHPDLQPASAQAGKEIGQIDNQAMSDERFFWRSVLEEMGYGMF